MLRVWSFLSSSCLFLLLQQRPWDASRGYLCFCLAPHILPAVPFIRLNADASTCLWSQPTPLSRSSLSLTVNLILLQLPPFSCHNISSPPCSSTICLYSWCFLYCYCATPAVSLIDTLHLKYYLQWKCHFPSWPPGCQPEYFLKECLNHLEMWLSIAPVSKWICIPNLKENLYLNAVSWDLASNSFAQHNVQQDEVEMYLYLYISCYSDGISSASHLKALKSGHGFL